MADWEKISSRGNVEDRRSWGPAVAGGLSVTGIIIYLLISLLTNGQVDIPIDQLGGGQVEDQENLERQDFEGADSYEVFASTVLGSNNEMWEKVFEKTQEPYVPPRLVLFRNSTESACGVANSQVGPHYCFSDETIYLDETFFDELTQQYGARGGDVAEAYIISHEVGHHAQNQMGLIDAKTGEIQLRGESANDLSIKLELQADCFAGLWANSIRDLDVLSPGEISEAMDAAATVGDDRIQEKVTGRISPENWTHGSSEQRVSWFTKGYESGTVSACDTFE
ncbi:MAG: neutral zinc metallopeptidase [Candidatus Shapirobacteria bacterium]